MSRQREPRGLRAAVEVFEDFHDFDHRRIGKFDGRMRIPSAVWVPGPCKYVTYKSDKWGKGTYEYIHTITSFPRVRIGLVEKFDGARRVTVPARVQKVEAVTLIGRCTGFSYVDVDGEAVECATNAKHEWFWSPSAKALILVEGKRRVVAVVWGGKLNVEPRGIVG